MAFSLYGLIPLAVSNKTAGAFIAALIVSAQLPMPAAARTIPDSADVTRFRKDPAHKPVPVNAEPASTISDGRMITAAALEAFLEPDVGLKGGVTKIDTASGVAY